MVVLAIIVVLAGLLLPLLRGPTDRDSKLIHCMNNLKQVAQAATVYAIKHGDRFPWKAPPLETNSFAGPIVDCYEPLRESFAGSGRFFVCPSDSKRSPTTGALQATNLSYFINLSSRMSGTNQVLAGDRHLATNGVAAGPGRIVLAPALPMGWTDELHHQSSKSGRGVVGFVDGHVETLMGNAKTTRSFGQSGAARTALLIP
jgi:prepilin-type processing-associated H-X9-DG protein